MGEEEYDNYDDGFSGMMSAIKNNKNNMNTNGAFKIDRSITPTIQNGEFINKAQLESNSNERHSNNTHQNNTGKYVSCMEGFQENLPLESVASSMSIENNLAKKNHLPSIKGLYKIASSNPSNNSIFKFMSKKLTYNELLSQNELMSQNELPGSINEFVEFGNCQQIPSQDSISFSGAKKVVNNDSVFSSFRTNNDIVSFKAKLNYEDVNKDYIEDDENEDNDKKSIGSNDSWGDS